MPEAVGPRGRTRPHRWLVRVVPRALARLLPVVVVCFGVAAWAQTPSAPVPPPIMVPEGVHESRLIPVLASLPPILLVLAVIGAGLRELSASVRGFRTSTGRARALQIWLATIVCVVTASIAIARGPSCWGLKNDEERDFFFSLACLRGEGCPNFGNEMGHLRLKLGPQNRYFMAAAHLVSDSPRASLTAAALLHGLGAGLLTWLAIALLGPIAGVAGGLLYGTNGLALATIEIASNGSWGLFFIVAAFVAAVRWAETKQPWLFLAAVTATATAGILHGSYLLLWGSLLLTIVLNRHHVPRRIMIASGVAVLVLYLPLLWYHAETRLQDLRNFSAGGVFASASVAPSVEDRLSRFIEPLGDALVLPPIYGWVVACYAMVGWLGLFVAKRGGRRLWWSVASYNLVPFPLVFAAGSAYIDRYAMVTVATSAFCAAFFLASLTSGPRLRVVGGLALIVLLSLGMQRMAKRFAVPGTLDARGRLMCESRGSGNQQLLSEQELEIRALEKHGYQVSDVNTRIHGIAWSRWTNGFGYLGYWLLPAKGTRPANEHAFVSSECAQPTSGFANWIEKFEMRPGRTNSIVGYTPRLSEPQVTIVFDESTRWQEHTPLYAMNVNHIDQYFMARVAPALAFSNALLLLPTPWNIARRRRFEVHATLEPGSRDEYVTFVADGGLPPPTVRIGGEERTPTEEQAFPIDGEAKRRRYLIHHDEGGGAPLPIEIHFDGPENGSLPTRIDLYEEPVSGCEPRLSAQQ